MTIDKIRVKQILLRPGQAVTIHFGDDRKVVCKRLARDIFRVYYDGSIFCVERGQMELRSESSKEG